ncbi:putative Zn peptidase [Desulfosporosinus acidiphilus SJ4]|uniref:Putative Zn peptidase n=1 Tax=Desulfosporosinus acidiphilus (strain DSM 22704 / JCM 16185 / SJ4) TaxID=646529 RepID=I4DB32_DESAJ|nr:ImmA/IrrE family metallo-endopeptidase [Desulfosporosinus acidiphilus]AFM43006.1 putative Zn peptidase [Desulfosporosinus acidiphilus SJ4]
MKKLWDIINKENIKVLYKDFSHLPENIHGLYFYEQRIGPLIVLDKNLHHSHRLHRCVLAEEIGHFYTAARTNILTVHTSANLQTIENQDERKAAQYATDLLIPDSELIKALESGCRSCFELAEYFDVTEWFMYRKLGFLKMCFRRTGLKVKGRDLFDIAMQPCHIIS